jgi:hypothetical protein
VGARPEEIRSEIEETRDRISAEIDELTDRYSPARVAGRKASGARDAAFSMRAKVGTGAAGMKQRLSLRSSSHHHEHSSTCGHLGEGQAGTGQAADVGSGRPEAERRGEARRRERGAPQPAPYPSDAARSGAAAGGAPLDGWRSTAASGSTYAAPGSPASYRSDTVYPPAPADLAPGRAERPAGLTGDASRPRRGAPFDEQQPAGRGQDRGRRISKGELGLLGASIVVGALGARTALHPSRVEQALFASAEHPRPDRWRTQIAGSSPGR